MTELEWLKQNSGMSDEELKAAEAVLGAKFLPTLRKVMDENSAAQTAKGAAEAERIALENRYQNEFIPEMRKVTQDSLRAQGEAAAAQAALKAAREYGIVPDEPARPAEVRAPGSPDPARPTFDEARFRADHSRAIITLQDLNAEHFKLYGAPLGQTQELVDMVQREHTLGHKDFTLQKAWETKYNVPAKREEMAKAEQQKVIDAAISADRKARAEAGGDNPHTRSGQPSRFSTYKPSDAATGTKPWQVPAGQRRSANQPWRDTAKNKLASVA